MINRLRHEFSNYPGQFWLMFVGMAFAMTGITIIWPFMMIYASDKLSLSLAAAASLMSINAATGLLSSILAGPIVDRLGRKWAMVISLVGNGVCYFLLNQADSYTAFALILGVSGVFSPLYNVGSDAMLADLFPKEKRAEAYALYRMARNIGVAVGPALGGFLLSRSYSIGLYSAAAGYVLYGILLLIFARETIPGAVRLERSNLIDQLRGYWQVFRDKSFMALVGAFTLVQMTTALMWVLLSVYVKTEYGIGENLYGWLPTTNALMVVFFQVIITRGTKKHPAVTVMKWGSVFYILAPLIVALSTGFWGFWAAMVVMTLGELVVVPRTSAYAANLAPIDKRGRYMSLYGLTWNVAVGISPVLGGFISDRFGHRAPWIIGVAFGFFAVYAFWLMARNHKEVETLEI